MRRPHGSTVRLRVTELEERTVPATLFVNLTMQWFYTASPGVQNNLTMDWAGPSYIITDSAETINVTGFWASFASGSGTHQVTIPTGLVGGVSVDLGDQSNQLNLLGTPSRAPVTINNTVGGTDHVYVGSLGQSSSSTLANIQGTVSVSNTTGSTSLALYDGGDTTRRVVSMYSNEVAGLAPANIFFTPSSSSSGGVTHLEVDGGSGNNFFHIVSTVAATKINGGRGINNLDGPDTTNTWVISSGGGGTVGKVSFTSFHNLVGGRGVDTFKFMPGGEVLNIVGGGAPAGQGDWLDYSTFPSTSAVTVNLATGSATGVAILVQNIQNVIGGAGTNTLTGNGQGNILIGGAGTNIITGGSGRSLLIGGKGQSTITGGASDDILIAGTTTYDANETALMAILQEWQRPDKTYAQRIQDLRTGGAGTYNGSAKLVWGTTVLDDDKAAATLTGGPGLDWFFANLGPGGVVDRITDRNNGGPEQVN
jgi:Ca2+-binding RTX toxin-like protein